MQRMDTIDALLYLLTELLKLVLGVQEQSPRDAVPLTPELRTEVRKLEQWDRQQRFLYRNGIQTAEELVSFMDKTESNIKELETERDYISNRIRRPKSKEEQEENKVFRRELSARIKPLREELRLAQRPLPPFRESKNFWNWNGSMNDNYKQDKKKGRINDEKHKKEYLH